VTINDVAERAGVSKATVSYVINGRNRVSDQRRALVLQAMEDLSYHPSAAARSLIRQSTSLIGFLIQHAGDTVYLDPYFSELIRGVAIMADAHAYSPVMVTVKDEAHTREVYRRIAKNGLVDGIIVCHLSQGDTYLLDEMGRDELPFVVVGSAEHRPCACVDTDNRGGAEQAVAHLVGLGHRRIGFINGPRSFPHAAQRLLGFRGALLLSGLSPEECPVVDGGFLREGGYAAMAQLLEASESPTAVFAASDQMAVGALHCLHERGMHVPDDVSVVGFDDNMLAPAAYPPLTTIHQPICQIGESAMDLLFKKIRGLPSPSSIILPTSLVARQSTGRPRDSEAASQLAT